MVLPGKEFIPHMWVFLGMMTEIELEIPIQGNSQISFFLGALKDAHIVETLKFGSEGVSFLCNATPEKWNTIRKHMGSNGDENNSLTLLSTKKDGTVVFLAEAEARS